MVSRLRVNLYGQCPAIARITSYSQTLQIAKHAIMKLSISCFYLRLRQQVLSDPKNGEPERPLQRTSRHIPTVFHESSMSLAHKWGESLCNKFFRAARPLG